MKKAFTLIELVVAVALLAMVLAFASTIFRVSIGATRTGRANSEIMQKLRAITDQLNTDFKGIQRDAPLLIWFQQDPNDPDQRYDQIMFFANGDFQSTQLYDSGVPAYTGEPVIGNVARIYYGQAQSLDPNDTMQNPWDLDEEDRLLARRRHILTADPDLYIWPGDVNETFGENYVGVEGYNNNEIFEHDRLSLSRWKTIHRNDYDAVISTCFGFRPWIDMYDPNTYHKLMCDGISSLAIQWAYWDTDDNELRWFPSDDPDGDGSYVDSHFGLMDPIDNEKFGVFFNVSHAPSPPPYAVWYPIEDVQYKTTGEEFPSDFYPEALKFTFTLYDSKGILEKGQRFTHIVYLD